MNIDETTKLEGKVKEQMQKVRDSGILYGCKAMCGAILKMANDKKKTEYKRLKDIINFCERSLEVVKKNGVIK